MHMLRAKPQLTVGMVGSTYHIACSAEHHKSKSDADGKVAAS